MSDGADALSKDTGTAAPSLGRTSVCSSVRSDTYTHEQHHRALAQQKARRSIETASNATDNVPGGTCGTMPHHAVLSHRAEELIELVRGCSMCQQTAPAAHGTRTAIVMSVASVLV